MTGRILATLLGVVLAASAFAAEVKTGTLAGTIGIRGGAPLAEGVAFFFNAAGGVPPAPERYWRVPDEMVPLDSQGRFTARLPVGDWYVGAVKRGESREIGPPREGDYFFMGRDENGKARRFSVLHDQRTEMGVLHEAVPFDRSLTAVREGTTGMEGVVLDRDGKPVAGVIVFAFASPTTAGRPLFVSERTGTDGRFLLRVADEGTYYLKIREAYGGGPPIDGAMVAGVGDESPLTVKVKRGGIRSDIEIRAHRFSRPVPGSGKQRKRD